MHATSRRRRWSSVESALIHDVVFGDASTKAQLRSGSSPMKKQLPERLAMFADAQLRPAAIIAYRVPANDAVAAYRVFDKKEQACARSTCHLERARSTGAQAGQTQTLAHWTVVPEPAPHKSRIYLIILILIKMHRPTCPHKCPRDCPH